MKHAFLIMAHNNFGVLRALLRQIDHPSNSVFIHMDKKAKDVDEASFRSELKWSELTFVPRINVKYGEYSMMDAVVSLMSSAIKGHFGYYHILSGADLLIKPLDLFFEFFEEHNGAQFVGFVPGFVPGDHALYRNYFVSMLRCRSKWMSLFFIKCRKALISLQKVFGCRIKHPWEIKKGADWYSVTHEAALYLLEQQPRFKRYFFRASGPAEYFSQTILWNSPFRESLFNLESEDEYMENMREIDWNRGSPYVYRMEDKEFLLSSKKMIARKFDQTIDMNIVTFFEEYVRGGGNI